MVVAAWCSAVPRSTTPASRVQINRAAREAEALDLRANRGRLVVCVPADVAVRRVEGAGEADGAGGRLSLGPW